jgi:hypothetical protein
MNYCFAPAPGTTTSTKQILCRPPAKSSLAPSLPPVLEGILGGKKGFINFDRQMLLDGSFAILPKEALVVEVLETVEARSGSGRRLRPAQ